MKILVLDSDESLNKIIQEDFQNRDIQVEICTDGKKAADLAISQDLDCILMDIMLPGLDGLQFIEQLRNNNKQMPIIVISAKDTIEEKVIAFENGADDFLLKPFDFRELLARIKAVTRRYRGDKHPVRQCGDLFLDPVARECRIDGKTVNLRRREFDILEFLMNNENQVFTREQIISQVWQKEYDGTSNVVDVHIKYLRDKLRINDYDRIVVTVRGVGYKVSCPDWH